MKCRNIQESLHLYISNEVSEKERKYIDTHLGECAECRNALMRIQETVHALHSDKDIELSPEYMARLRWKLQEVENEKTRRLAPRIKWALAVHAVQIGVIIVLAIFGFSLYQDRKSKDEAIVRLRNQVELIPELKKQLNATTIRVMLLQGEIKANRNKIIFFSAHREVESIPESSAKSANSLFDFENINKVM